MLRCKPNHLSTRFAFILLSIFIDRADYHILFTDYPVSPVFPGPVSGTYATFNEYNDRSIFSIPLNTITIEPDDLPEIYTIYSQPGAHVILYHKCKLWLIYQGSAVQMNSFEPCTDVRIYRITGRLLLQVATMTKNAAGATYRKYRLSIGTKSTIPLNGLWHDTKRRNYIKDNNYLHAFRCDDYFYIVGQRKMKPPNKEEFSELYLGRLCVADISEGLASYMELIVTIEADDRFLATSSKLIKSVNSSFVYLFIGKILASKTDLFVLDTERLNKEFSEIRRKCSQGSMEITYYWDHVARPESSCKDDKANLRSDFIDTCGDGDGIVNHPTLLFKIGSPIGSVNMEGSKILSVYYNYPLSGLYVYVFGDQGLANCSAKDVTSITELECADVQSFDLSKYRSDKAFIDPLGFVFVYPKSPSMEPITKQIFHCNLLKSCVHCEVYGTTQSYCAWADGTCNQLARATSKRPQNGYPNMCFQIESVEPSELAATDKFNVKIKGYSPSDRETTIILFNELECSDAKLTGETIECTPLQLSSGTYNITVIITSFIGPGVSLGNISATWNTPVTVTFGVESVIRQVFGREAIFLGALGAFAALIYGSVLADKKYREAYSTPIFPISSLSSPSTVKDKSIEPDTLKIEQKVTPSVAGLQKGKSTVNLPKVKSTANLEKTKSVSGLTKSKLAVNQGKSTVNLPKVKSTANLAKTKLVSGLTKSKLAVNQQKDETLTGLAKTKSKMIVPAKAKQAGKLEAIKVDKVQSKNALLAAKVQSKSKIDKPVLPKSLGSNAKK